MKAINNIQYRYRPFQPWAMDGSSEVSYREFFPSFLLEENVVCYWTLESIVPLSVQYRYGVVADGCIDVFFDVQNPEDSSVMGLSESFVDFELTGPFCYAGIRFKPGVFPHLFGIDALELTGRCEALKTVDPTFAHLISVIFDPKNIAADVKLLLDKCMLRLFEKICPKNMDPRVYAAVGHILGCSGNIRVEKDLDLGVSPRNLQRLFNFYIGSTPKIFSRIVRFQHTLRFCTVTNAVVANSHFIDAGYYDQAHFIRDFKHFYGKSPGKVLFS